MAPEFTGMHTLYFQLTGNEKVEGPPSTYKATIVLGLYEADPVAHKKRLKEYEQKLLKNFNGETVAVASENVVPPAPDVNSSEDWWRRTPYTDRKA